MKVSNMIPTLETQTYYLHGHNEANVSWRAAAYSFVIFDAVINYRMLSKAFCDKG